MSWQQYVYLAWAILASLLVISQIGKPRKPIQPGEAIIQVILIALFTWLVLSI